MPLSTYAQHCNAWLEKKQFLDFESDLVMRIFLALIITLLTSAIVYIVAYFH